MAVAVAFLRHVPWYLAGIDASLQGPGRRTSFGVRPYRWRARAALLLLSLRGAYRYDRGFGVARAARRQLGLLRVTPSALPLLRVCETRAAPWQLELVAFRPVPCGAASTWVQPPPALWGFCLRARTALSLLRICEFLVRPQLPLTQRYDNERIANCSFGSHGDSSPHEARHAAPSALGEPLAAHHPPSLTQRFRCFGFARRVLLNGNSGWRYFEWYPDEQLARIAAAPSTLWLPPARSCGTTAASDLRGACRPTAIGAGDILTGTLRGGWHVGAAAASTLRLSSACSHGTIVAGFARRVPLDGSPGW